MIKDEFSEQQPPSTVNNELLCLQARLGHRILYGLHRSANLSSEFIIFLLVNVMNSLDLRIC
jgi:hypothetical protein